MAHQPTQIEKENLETHVELCALRYQNLENRLTNIETKVESLVDTKDQYKLQFKQRNES